MLPCAYKSLLGIDCPACGLQRSFIQFMKGNFSESLAIYPPLPAVLSFFILLAVYGVNKKLVSKKLLVTSSWVMLAIVMVSYIVKLIFFRDTHVYIT